MTPLGSLILRRRQLARCGAGAVLVLLAFGALGARPVARAAGPAQQVPYGPTVRAVAGSDAATLQEAIDTFKADLGGDNNGVGNTFPTGRREINWDGVPDQFAAPNPLPGDFFNKNSARGAVLSTAGTGFQVSANDGVAPVRFGNIDPSYATAFSTFSPQRLFTALDSNSTDVTFFLPGASTAATVSGFGAVFTNVRLAGAATLEYFDPSGASLGVWPVPEGAAAGLSFLGVSWRNGTKVARVRITSGTDALGAGVYDYGSTNVVVMDDFIYGEPQASG